MNYFIGLDCGGTFLKAGIYDQYGKEQAIERTSLEILSPHAGYAERDMQDFWERACLVIKNVVARTSIPIAQIKGIGISAQGKGVYLLDHAFMPLGTAILSSDQRSLKIVEKWQQVGLPQKIYPFTLQTLWTGHPVSILRWIKDNEPTRYKKIAAVLMGHDFLRFKMTGKVQCEITNISESNYFNAQTNSYDPELLSEFGIEDIYTKLPPIIGASEIAGTLLPEIAKDLGLSPTTIVAGGLFDVVATALCAGIKDDTKINAVMGTWSVSTGVTTSIDTKQSYPFVYGHHAQKEHYIVHEASPTSAANLEWVAKQLNVTDYSKINQLVGSLAPVATSIIFVPFLYGSNAGLGLKSSFWGLQSTHSKADIFQAVYEGILFCHLVHLEKMFILFPKAQIISVTGGSARSAIWMQMFADLTHKTIELSDIEETGCLGAALSAAIAVGQYPDYWSAIAVMDIAKKRVLPRLEYFEAYQNKYQKYKKFVALLAEFETK
ncbi:L-xylulose kinase [Gammaproteobacteria bacterium]|nr:L-xylulose kinase [Gammaproteobacteria bacterium]